MCCTGFCFHSKGLLLTEGKLSIEGGDVDTWSATAELMSVGRVDGRNSSS